ncbi:MAG: glycosyltransferase family 2 protein [Clostridia bacterium]|nr:glycosyltransferase family 2 protein [Clostridia bacterium]
MDLDIVIVTYNSKKWLEECITSIEGQKEIDLNKINLYFIDNKSKDDTISELKKYREKTKLGSFNIIENENNLGFGQANNLGFEKGKSEYVFFLNHDTKLDTDSLKNMKEAITNSSDQFVMWEFRQKPYEHPKYYDPLTGETSWASGACFIIKREIFKKINGFDKKIFMYAEDVDLSWKVRLEGYKIKYVPKATLTHYCYKEAGEIKPVQYYNSIINNLNLRYKYGKLSDVLIWTKYFGGILLRKEVFKGSKSGLIKAYFKNIFNFFHFRFWRFGNGRRKKLKKFTPKFYRYDYEIIRNGAFLTVDEIEEKPLVSILVRTCGRPNVLRENLLSLRNQTYKNIEVVIVEDGKNISEKMIKDEFPDLNIKYEATGEKKGRCYVGNRAMEIASGKYLNFLDDDDLFFADHVETLVRELNKNKEYKLAYTISYETKISVISKEPEYKYEVKGIEIAHDRPYSRVRLLTMNMFPIQAVMFEKEIFEKYGGMDVELDNLEDWEMWARFGMENKYLYIPKVTSIYRVPAKVDDYKERQEEIDSYYKKAREKILSREVVIKAADLDEEVKYM